MTIKERYELHKKAVTDPVSLSTFTRRYYHLRWSWDKCINTPSQGRGGDRKLNENRIIYNNSHKIVSYTCFKARINMGWTLEQALNMPKRTILYRPKTYKTG